MPQEGLQYAKGNDLARTSLTPLLGFPWPALGPSQHERRTMFNQQPNDQFDPNDRDRDAGPDLDDRDNNPGGAPFPHEPRRKAMTGWYIMGALTAVALLVAVCS